MSEKRPKIGVGYTVGMLTVESRSDETKSGYSVWNCRCECGGMIRLDTRALQRRRVSDCGCNTFVKPGMLDLTGMRFGKLLCLEVSDEKDKNGGTQWLCRCDCGRDCLAAVHQLRLGYKKSCGCSRYPALEDITGRRFGKLTVTAYAGKQNGMHRWQCLCDCGKTVSVGQTLLMTGKTKSCGCLKADQIRKNADFVDGSSAVLIEYHRSKLISTNKSGYTGVYRNKRLGKWAAQITFRNKTYHLGCYDRLEDAVKARRRGEEMQADFLEWYYQVFKKEKEEKKM